MTELKKVFDAARAIQDHNMKQAASTLGEDGYSLSTLNRFFGNNLEYTYHVEKAVREYIYNAGLIKSVQDLGLDPNQSAKTSSLTAQRS